MGGDPLTFVYLIGLLVLVGSALAIRREPIGKLAKMALAWIGIFAVIFVIFTFRDDFGYLASRVQAEATGAPIEQGDSLRIPMAIDGHFYVEAQVNGTPVEFMVDSGATVTTLGRSSARAAGIEFGPANVPVYTANGVVAMHPARADTLEIGDIERRRMRVHVAPNDDLNVIGMNFLSSLDRWGVEGRWLILED